MARRTATEIESDAVDALIAALESLGLSTAMPSVNVSERGLVAEVAGRRFGVEVKPVVTAALGERLARGRRRHHLPRLIVADRIAADAKRSLRDAEVNYFDRRGELRIVDPPLVIDTIVAIAYKDNPDRWGGTFTETAGRSSRMKAISFRIPSDELARLQEAAASEDVTRSKFIRDALRNSIAERPWAYSWRRGSGWDDKIDTKQMDVPADDLGDFSVKQQGLAAVHSSAIQSVQVLLHIASLEKLAETHREIAKNLADSPAFSVTPDVTYFDAFVHNKSAARWMLKEQLNLWVRVSEQLKASLSRVDASDSNTTLRLTVLPNHPPDNRSDEIDDISQQDGIPLSRIPRLEIVDDLLKAPDSDTRFKILEDRKADILEDCRKALESVEDNYASPCRDAVAALQAGLDGPAQSHSSNIIDSILRTHYHPKKGPKIAKKMAEERYSKVLYHLAADHLVADYLAVRPLRLALYAWYPGEEKHPPNHFSRHATAHAIGHPGVVKCCFALISVMLATSLTVHFASRREN